MPFWQAQVFLLLTTTYNLGGIQDRENDNNDNTATVACNPLGHQRTGGISKSCNGAGRRHRPRLCRPAAGSWVSPKARAPLALIFLKARSSELRNGIDLTGEANPEDLRGCNVDFTTASATTSKAPMSSSFACPHPWIATTSLTTAR